MTFSEPAFMGSFGFRSRTPSGGQCLSFGCGFDIEEELYHVRVTLLLECVDDADLRGDLIAVGTARALDAWQVATEDDWHLCVAVSNPFDEAVMAVHDEEGATRRVEPRRLNEFLDERIYSSSRNRLQMRLNRQPLIGCACLVVRLDD